MYYSLKGILRNTKNSILKTFFEERNILTDFKWTKKDKQGNDIPLPETEVDGLEEAINTLSTNDRLKIEQEFKDIAWLADENSNFCLIDQGKKPKYALDLVKEFDQYQYDGYCDRSMWVYLKHNELFRYTYKFMQVIETANSREFQVGKNLKCKTAKKDRDTLKQHIIKHYKDKGRGEKCILDYYHRTQDTEQHCYYLFHEDCVKTVLDFNKDGTDVVRNPQRDIFENIFFYEPKTGTLQIHANGERNTEELADLFCTHILDLQGRPDKNTEIFDLSKLKTPDFKFDTERSISKINLKEIICDMGNNEEIILRIPGREEKGLLLLERLHTMIKAYAVDPFDVTILKLKYQAVFPRQDQMGTKKRTCEITLPNKIGLNTDSYGNIIRKHIEQKWKFKRILLAENETIEAA
jgi:hypothetical protein